MGLPQFLKLRVVLESTPLAQDLGRNRLQSHDCAIHNPRDYGVLFIYLSFRNYITPIKFDSMKEETQNGERPVACDAN